MTVKTWTGINQTETWKVTDRHEAECARVEAEFNGTDIPMVTYWRGERVDEMTREELLEAFEDLGELYNLLLEQNVRVWQRRK